MGLHHRESVHERAVAAAEIADGWAPLLEHDLAVEARHRAIVEHQVVRLVATDGGTFAGGDAGAVAVRSLADGEPHLTQQVVGALRGLAQLLGARRRRSVGRAHLDRVYHAAQNVGFHTPRLLDGSESRVAVTATVVATAMVTTPAARPVQNHQRRVSGRRGARAGDAAMSAGATIATRPTTGAATTGGAITGGAITGGAMTGGATAGGGVRASSCGGSTGFGAAAASSARSCSPRRCA